MKVFYYINQLQFSIVRRTTLRYDLLYFCLPAERFTEVCVIVILQSELRKCWSHLLPHTALWYMRSFKVHVLHPGETVDVYLVDLQKLVIVFKEMLDHAMGCVFVHRLLCPVKRFLQSSNSMVTLSKSCWPKLNPYVDSFTGTAEICWEKLLKWRRQVMNVSYSGP